MESLLTGNQSHQIIELLRKHVKDDKVKPIKGGEQYIPVVAGFDSLNKMSVFVDQGILFILGTNKLLGHFIDIWGVFLLIT